MSGFLRFCMADGAKEMTKSIREVFGLGEGGSVRLMCWSHVYRCYSTKLAPIKKVNKDLAKSIDMDIQNIQWMSQTEEEFKTVYTLLEQKYLEGPYQEQVQIQGFFDYFRLQWGPDSPVSRWYEGSYPFHNCTNMGLERRNCDLKDDFSYRDQLNMGQFVGMMEDASEHYSKRDDCVLDGNRLLILSKDEDGKEERDSFKIQETGYKYFAENLKPLPPTAPGEPELLKPGRQIEINDVSDCRLLWHNPGMDLEGQVVKRIIGLPSKTNKIQHKSLTQLLVTSLGKRARPMYNNLQEYYDVRTSCHIVEQVGRDFYCNCMKGMKGKLCIETMALTYSRVPQFEVHKNIDTVHFKRGRRPVGRPRHIGGALSVAVPRALEEVRHTDQGVAAIQVVQFVEEVAKQQEEQLEQEDLLCSSQSACEEREQKRAVVKCDTCKDRLCDECNQIHSRARITKQHLVTVLVLPESTALALDTSIPPLETINPPLETTTPALETTLPDTTLETNIPGLEAAISLHSNSPLVLPTSPVFPTSYLPTIQSTPIAVTSHSPISLPAPTLAKKCRAKFGVHEMEKWCKPCTKKKKCIGAPVVTSQPSVAVVPTPKRRKLDTATTSPVVTTRVTRRAPAPSPKRRMLDISPSMIKRRRVAQ